MSAVDMYDFQVEPLKGMGPSSFYFEPFLASWECGPRKYGNAFQVRE